MHACNSCFATVLQRTPPSFSLAPESASQFNVQMHRSVLANDRLPPGAIVTGISTAQRTAWRSTAHPLQVGDVIGREAEREGPDGDAAGEAELAARDGSVGGVKLLCAHRAKGAVVCELEGAGREAVEVDTAHQPHLSVLCKNGMGTM